MDSAAARRGVVRVCRRLDERGLIAGQDGNVSVRLGPDRILITPAGFSKADVTEEDLVTLGLDGARVAGRREPSTEVAMHLAALVLVTIPLALVLHPTVTAPAST